nr:immunoglobulin light chain junction region [Macaca mulatta]
CCSYGSGTTYSF